MADFAELLKKLSKEAGDHEAGSATKKCPDKCPPVIVVMVARADNASTLAGISVELSGATSAKKSTGADGMAKFDPVKPGKHTIKLALTDAQQKDYIALAPHVETVADGTTATVLLQLKPKPSLDVTVVVNKGGAKTAVDDITVVLTGPSPEKKSEDKKSTKPAGIAKFEKIAPGRYSVEAKLTDKQAEDFIAPPALKVTLTDKNEKVSLELVPTEANAVRITKLDKWFIPGNESCDIGYILEGPRAAADRLVLEIYASNYCEFDSWNDGLPKFKPLADTPIFVRGLNGAFVEEKAAKSITDWKGEANCAKGLFMHAGGSNRFVNVALSPYTIHFRYYKDDPDDAKARIDLSPFWPHFDNVGAPIADSLKIKYTIKETTRLKLGRLVIWDKDDKEVFKKDLAETDVGKGDHAIDWDGKMTDGKKITAASLPFRVQVQAHTKKGQSKGLALAASHTEVRLYVHPDTTAVDTDPYVAANDKSSLLLDFAKLVAKDKDPIKDADGRLWTKFALAKNGFHPGPVNDASANPHFNTALAEFQRSVPKNATAPFQRLTISLTGNDDNDTKSVLATLPANRRRAWFGKVADKSDYLDANERRNDFRDPTKTMILWVDDRHWYTDPTWLRTPADPSPGPDDVVPTIRSQVKNHRTAVGDLRGAYTDKDSRVGYDARDIARPWIPVLVDFRVLSKTQQLSDKLVDTPTDKALSAMRQAIGPLRVDWSFDEIDGDAIKVPEVDRTLYHKERTRTRAALEWALDNLKTNQYARKDVKRKANYFNCPIENGGIRPKTGAGYYKAPFGMDSSALLPWKPADDPGRETIATVVHDNVGQDAANIFKVNRLGRAGVYFHPSLMAGDGYRLRAQVWFAPHPSYDFANLQVLSKRYPRPPQAHSAALRLWRKSSIRGYLQWGPNVNWPGTRAGMLTQYHAAHVHLVNELGVSDAAINVALNQIWNSAVPAELNAYRAVIKSCIAGAADPRRTDGNIQLVGNQMWPWTAHADLGLLGPIGPNPPASTDVWRGISDQVSPLWSKLTNRIAIEVADTLERKFGRFRGHIIVEFATTTDFWARQYKCNNAACNRIYYYAAQNGTTVAHHNGPCPFPGCGGQLQDTGAANALRWASQLPASSLGDPLGVSFNFDGTARLWAHELGHNRYFEHAANAPGAYDRHHDHVNNPAVAASNWRRKDAAAGVFDARQWDRTCLMTYVTHLNGDATDGIYNAAKDVAFFCFRCVLKNRGWKLGAVGSPPSAALVNDPPAATKDP